MNARAQSQTQLSTSSFTSAPVNLIQRKCACGGSAGLSSECAECQKEKLVGENPPLVQPKLKIGQPNDKYEQEADRVADEVMRMPEPKVQRQVGVQEDEDEEIIQTKPITSKITPLVQRQISEEDEDEEDEEEIIQKKGAASRNFSTVTKDAESSIESLKENSGMPLPEKIRSYMEPRFGQDFSRVRIHTDTKAAASVQSVNASAFTLGHDVVFGAGQYAPEATEGRKLLAHELTHVIQQGRDHEYTWQGVVQRAPPDQSSTTTDLGQKRKVPPRVFIMGKSTRGGNRSLNVDIGLSGRARVVPIGSRDGASLRESWIEAFQEEFLIQLNETTLLGRDPDEILRALNYLRGKDSEIEMLGDPELDASFIFMSVDEYEEAAKAERLAAIEATLRTQNPEDSPRYQTQDIKKSEPEDPKDPTGPKKTVTDFRCNTFATDFVDLIANTAGVFNAYLPKVWWSHPKAAKRQSTDLDSAKVFSQAPQGLNRWLQKWGGDYGWVEITDPENAGKIAQEKANQGILVIFSLSNHIGLIVAETPTISALRNGDEVTQPVIAQAGVTKIKRGQKTSSLKFDETWLYFYDPSQDKSLGGTVIRR